MSDEYLIATGVVKSFLQNKDFFTYNYLKKCILDNGGIMRISANFSVHKLLEELRDDGKLILEYTNDNINVTVVNLNYKRRLKIKKLKKLI